MKVTYFFFRKKKKNLFVQETDRFSFDCFSLVKFQQLKKKSLWARQLPIMVSTSISMVQMRQAAVMSLTAFNVRLRSLTMHVRQPYTTRHCYYMKINEI